jgi:hypothetical protein
MKYVELMIVMYFLSYSWCDFAGATASSVKAAMAQKCKDKRNADTKRRKIAEVIWTAKFFTYYKLVCMVAKYL